MLNAAAKSVDEILVETGLNSGNLMFFSALRRVVKHTVESHGMAFDPAVVRERHDGIIIPAANWLTARRDLTDMARLIEKADLPTNIVGLGAQAFENRIPELLPGTQRFLKVISDRCHSLSVRGDFTAEVVAAAGIKNVVVTGCPSLLWNVDRPAQVTSAAVPLSKVSMHGTRYEGRGMLDPSDKSYIGLLMMRFARERAFDYVAQTERDDIVAADLNNDTLALSALRQLKLVYGAGSVAELRKYLAAHLKFFHDPVTWIAYMKGRQLSFGTRLHGVIAGLLAGTPGILVTHDTRTLEMANKAGIPHVAAQAIITNGIDIESIYADADFDAFNKRQITYYGDFLKFFADNQIANNLVPQRRPSPPIPVAKAG